MKLCTIVGARPQFIKAATVSRVVAGSSDMTEVMIHTGQHYDRNMSSQFFEELDIPKPAYHLNIGSGLHGQQTGQMLGAIEEVLLREKPDWVLVYGDTNSTLAGALAAVKLHIPVAHVEAGLRSFNRNMPEEINRIMSDHVSSLLFTPTEGAYQRLLQEGISAEHVVNVGDVMYDAVLYYNEYNVHRKSILDVHTLQPQAYYLATIHRAENTDNAHRLKHICDALLELNALKPVVLPMHPRTRAALMRLGCLEALERNITLIEPVGYLDMLALEQNALGIITDSGGVQKEAYFNRVPCVTVRDETEWVELVEAGCNVLCSPEHPFSLVNLLAEQSQRVVTSNRALYGDGSAAEKIVKAIVENV